MYPSEPIIPTTTVAGCTCLICKPVSGTLTSQNKTGMATYQFSNEELQALIAMCGIIDTHVSRAMKVTITAILAARNSR